MSAAASPLGRRSATPRELDEFVADGLADAAQRQAIAVVRFPAPDGPLDAPLRALVRGTSIAWRSPSGGSVSGHGAAVTVRLCGEDRFKALSDARREIFSNIAPMTHASVTPRQPRLYGGWSFTVGGASSEPWRSFGDGRFVLPRWTYEHNPSTLTLALDLRDGCVGRIAVAHAELAELLRVIRKGDAARVPAGCRIVRELEESRARWTERVDACVRAIGAGKIEKVVAARRHAVFMDRDLDPWAVLRRLDADYPDTWRFGFSFGSGTFLGATPERLFEKRGRRIETDALAGSIATDVPDAETQLRRSLKDQREHRPVVEHLQRALRTLADRIEPAGRPRVRRLPNVLHLHTPLSAVLREGVKPETLAAWLHPSPAVAGVPRTDAVRWIEECEPHPRGWYCGPVGWIDAGGDAELTVALRCGVIRGASAWLYAGGGIVDGSEPEGEWEESALKLQPLLHAIGG